MGIPGSTAISQPVFEPELVKKDKASVEAHVVVPKKVVEKSPDINKLLESFTSYDDHKGEDPVEKDNPKKLFISEEKGSELKKNDNLMPSKKDDLEEFRKFRDDLLSFSLGESAFDYAERLFDKQPNNPHVMALLAETAAMYDTTKNKSFKPHWVDRMDLLQRAIDVSRRCNRMHPDYGPCYRTYTIAAARASEALYYYRWMKGMGIVENYKGIMEKGKKGVELMPDDSDIPNILGAVNGRCSQYCFFPYVFYNWIYHLPKKDELLKLSIFYHKMAVERDPGSLEKMHRLGMAYHQSGDYDSARKCLYAVRDEMTPRDIKDKKWQDAAHTLIAGGFDKNKRWNLPFG